MAEAGHSGQRETPGQRQYFQPPQDVELALKGQESVDVHAFAAKYLPTETLDEMIVCVEATIGA